MANPLHDTIAAPITGAQRAAVAIVRVSGPDAWKIAANLFDPLPALPEARRAYYGQFSHGDDGFLLLFAEGASFTGEASAEFHLHGSPSSVRALLEHCHRQGARLAEPGEFTYRAFMNGRIDLTEAEGVRETVESQTQRQFRQSQPGTPARLILSGQSSSRLQRLLQPHQAAGDVLHLGFVSSAEVAAVYADSAGVIIPTLFEGFGMPVVEGLGYGRPVCCSDLPVFHELVGDAVRYFDPQSVQSIRTAVGDLFSGRVAVPDQARIAEILDRLNWERCAAETYAVFSQVTRKTVP